MKEYGVLRRIWRAISFPLIYLGTQVAVTFIFSFAYSFSLGLKQGLDENSTLSSSEIVAKTEKFMTSSIIWIVFVSAIICLMIFYRVFVKEKSRYCEPEYKLNGLSVALGIGIVLSFESILILLMNIIDISKIFPSYNQVQESLSSGPVIIQLLTIVIIIPIVEELCFRGITFSRLNRRLCAPLAIIIQGIIFGAAHMNLFQGIYAGLLGIILGFLYFKYRNLTLVIILHIAFNFLNGIIYQIMNMKYIAQNKYIVLSIFILLTLTFSVLIAKHKPERVEIKHTNMKGGKSMESQEILVNEETTAEVKKHHTSTLVLMIIGLVFALLLPIVTYSCSIISLVFAVTKRKEYKTKYAIILNIIALVIALANSVLGVLIRTGIIKL